MTLHLPRTAKRRLALALTAAVVAAPLATAAPAMALDGPQANDDTLHQAGRGPITLNVLANDSWDSGETATLTSVTLLDDWARIGHAVWKDDIPDPTLSFDAIGTVTVDFGPYAFPEPSLQRFAHVAYTFQDSVGQSASGVMTVSDRNADGAPVAANDNWASSIGKGVPGNPSDAWADIANGLYPNPLANDTFGLASEARLEILSQPTDGVVEVRTNGGQNDEFYFTPPTVRSDEFTGSFVSESSYSVWTDDRHDSFTYRVCNAEGCSDPATFTMNYRVVKQIVTVPDIGPVVNFAEGGADRFVLNPREVADESGEVPAAALANAYASAPYGPLINASLADNGDGSWTITSTGFPTTPFGATEYVRWDMRDVDTHALVAVVSVSVYHRERPATEAEDDEVWVRTGDIAKVRLFLNDTLPFGVSARGNWVGLPWGQAAWSEPANRWRVSYDSSPTLGWLGAHSGSVFVDSQVNYVAEGVAGTDQLAYTVCPPFPGDAACTSANLTVHVSPDVDAEDDAATLDEPGTVEDLPLLGNDVFNDIDSTSPYAPALRTAEVTLFDVPAGVTAAVNPDRTVNVTTTAPGTFDLTYQLRDFTGTDTATLRVTVGEATVVTPPTARDDVADAVVGEPKRVKVLDNDRFSGSPKVRLLGAPKGVKAKVEDGEVVVTAPRSAAGDTLRLRYRLTDSTGLSDTATVRVRVAPVLPPPVTGGGYGLAEPGVAAAAPAGDGGAPSWALPLAAGLLVGTGAAVTGRLRRRGGVA